MNKYPEDMMQKMLSSLDQIDNPDDKAAVKAILEISFPLLNLLKPMAAVVNTQMNEETGKFDMIIGFDSMIRLTLQQLLVLGLPKEETLFGLQVGRNWGEILSKSSADLGTPMVGLIIPTDTNTKEAATAKLVSLIRIECDKFQHKHALVSMALQAMSMEPNNKGLKDIN